MRRVSKPIETTVATSALSALSSLQSTISTYTLCLLLLSTLFPPLQACPKSCECNKKGVVEVTCKNGQLLDIFTQVNPRTSKLMLDNVDDLRIIDKDLIRDLQATDIVELIITSSSVKSIEANAFQKLPHLEKLDLSVNLLMSVHAEAFSNLTELKHLNLSHNRLATLGQVLDHLPKLDVFDVSVNSLKDLPEGLFQAQTSLTFLKLDGNPLKNLYAHSFAGLGKLKEFRARDCSIVHIDEDVFAAMPNVALIDLGHNRLVHFPQSSAFSGLTLLRKIYVDNNEIQTLLPEEFGNLHLQRMDLSYNRISKMNNMSFKGSSLSQIDLSYNMIISLERDVLKPLADHVTVLSLAGNPLQKMQPNVFADLYLLDTLNMSSCSLETLKHDLFKELKALRVLDISSNNLHSLSDPVLKFFNELYGVILNDNKWTCDCEIIHLRDWLKIASSASKIHCPNIEDGTRECSNLRCSAPSDLHNIQIVRLEDKEIAKCEHEKSSTLPASTQGAIVASCMGFAVVLLIVTIYLWRRGHTGHGLKRVCVPSEAESSHIVDEDSKVPPLADCRRASLTLSDHNFVFRHYFDHLVTDPKLMADGDEEEEDEDGEPSGAKERDSLYSSQPSLYSNHDDAGYGMESTV